MVTISACNWGQLRKGLKVFKYLWICTKCWGRHYDHLLICLHYRGEERFHICVFSIRLFMAWFWYQLCFSPLVVLIPITHLIISLWFIPSHTNAYNYEFFCSSYYCLVMRTLYSLLIEPPSNTSCIFVLHFYFVCGSWSYINILLFSCIPCCVFSKEYF